MESYRFIYNLEKKFTRLRNTIEYITYVVPT